MNVWNDYAFSKLSKTTSDILKIFYCLVHFLGFKIRLMYQPAQVFSREGSDLVAGLCSLELNVFWKDHMDDRCLGHYSVSANT